VRLSLEGEIDYRTQPHLYRVGRESRAFRSANKGELLPLWRFKTPAEARKSCSALLAKLNAYLRAGNFVGADMARKFLQMGYTRASRYANYKGGRKYDKARDFALSTRGTGGSR
jgi:hypothetical protein